MPSTSTPDLGLPGAAAQVSCLTHTFTELQIHQMGSGVHHPYALKFVPVEYLRVLALGTRLW
jgi:hypothetical protein